MQYLKNFSGQISAQNKRQITYYVCLLIVIGLAIWLRFFMLSNQSFWVDEGLTLKRIDRDTFQEVILNFLQQNSVDKYQPIYFLLLFWWRSVFGDTEFAIRSLSALLGSGFVIVIYLTALKLYGKNHAFWSLIIVSFSSFSVYYSQEARPYALLMFLASLQLYLFFQVINSKKINKGLTIWSFWLVTFLGLCNSIFMSIFTLALVLSDLIVYRNLRRWLKIWLPFIILGIPILLFIFTSSIATRLNFSLFTHQGLPIFKNIVFVLYGILVGTTFGPSIEELHDIEKFEVILGYLPQFCILLVVSILIFIPLLLKLFRYTTVSKNNQTDLLFVYLFLISLFLGFIFALFTQINWVPRHSFYLVIPLVLLIPSVFSSRYHIDRKHHIPSSWTRIAVLILIILNIYSLNNYYFNQSYWKDDYRSASQYLIDKDNDSTQSVLLWGAFKLFEYYNYPKIINARKLNTEYLVQKINFLTHDSNTVYLVINRDFYWYPSPNYSIEKEMSDLYTLKSKVSFPYFKIYQFIKKN